MRIVALALTRLEEGDLLSEAPPEAPRADARTALSLARAATNLHRHTATPCMWALRLLRLSILWGLEQPTELLEDRELDPLRGDTRFQALVLTLGRVVQSGEVARASNSLLAALAWPVEDGDDVACETSPTYAQLAGRPPMETTSALVADVMQALDGALASESVPDDGGSPCCSADGPSSALLPFLGALAEEREGRSVAARLLARLAACPGHVSLLLPELAAGRPTALRPFHALLAMPAPISGEAHPVSAVVLHMLQVGGEGAADVILTALLQSCVRLGESRVSGRDLVFLSLSALARPGLGPALGVAGMRTALERVPLHTWRALTEADYALLRECGTVELGQVLPCTADEAPRAAQGLLLLAQALALSGQQAIVDELVGAAIALRCKRTTRSTFGAHAANALLQYGPLGRRGLGTSDSGHAFLSRPQAAGVPAPWEGSLISLYRRLGKSAPLPPSMAHCFDAVVIIFATVAAHACGVLPHLLRLAEEGPEEAPDIISGHIWPAALRAGRRALPAIKATAWLQAVYAATASSNGTEPTAADAAAHVHAALRGLAAQLRGVEEELGVGEAEALLSLLGLPVGCNADATLFAIQVWLAGADPMSRGSPTEVVSDRVRRLALPLLRLAPVADDAADESLAIEVCRHAALLLAPALLPTQGPGVRLSENSLHAAIAALAAADGDANPAFIAECLSTAHSIPLGAAASLFPLLAEPGVDGADPCSSWPRLLVLPLSWTHRGRLRELVVAWLTSVVLSDDLSAAEFGQRCATLTVLANCAPSVTAAVISGAVDLLCVGIRRTLSSSIACARSGDSGLELVMSGGCWMRIPQANANGAANSRFDALNSLSCALRACMLSSANGGRTPAALNAALQLADAALAHAVEDTAESDLASRRAACHFAALCLSSALDGLEATDWADVRCSEGVSRRLMDAALSLNSAPAWALGVLTEADGALFLQCLPWLARLTGDMGAAVGGLFSFLASPHSLDFCLPGPTVTRYERPLDRALQRCIIGEVGGADGSEILHLRLLLVPNDAAALSALESELRCSHSALTRLEEDESMLVLLATYAAGLPSVTCVASGAVFFQPGGRLVDEEPPFLSLSLLPTRLSLWDRVALCAAVVRTPWQAWSTETQIQCIRVPPRISVRVSEQQLGVSVPAGTMEESSEPRRLFRVELQCPMLLTPSGLAPISGEALMDAVDAALDSADVEEDEREQALDRLGHGLMRVRTSAWSVLHVLPVDDGPVSPVWLPLLDAPSEIAMDVGRALSTVPISAGAGRPGSVACGAGLSIVSRFVPLDALDRRRANVLSTRATAGGFPSPRLSVAAIGILRDFFCWSEQCISVLMLHLVKALSGDSAMAGAALAVLGGSSPLITEGSTVGVPVSVCRSLLPDSAVIDSGGPWVSARVENVAFLSARAAEASYARLLCDGTADVGASLPPAHVPMHILGAVPPALVLRQPSEGDEGDSAPYVCPSILPSSDMTAGCIRACAWVRVRCKGQSVTIGPVPISLLAHSEEFGAPAALEREAGPPCRASGHPLPPQPVPSWRTRLVQHALAPYITSGIVGLVRKAVAGDDTKRICELSRVCAALLAAVVDATVSDLIPTATCSANEYDKQRAPVLALLPVVVALQEWVSAAPTDEGVPCALAHATTNLVLSAQRAHSEMRSLAPPAGASPAVTLHADADICATPGWIALCSRAESPPWMMHVESQRREDDPRRATPALLGGFTATAFASACLASATAAAGISGPSQSSGTGAVESSARRFIQLVVSGLPGQLVGTPSAAPASSTARDTIAHSPTRLPLSHCVTEWASSIAVLREVAQTRCTAERTADRAVRRSATCVISPEAMALKQAARSAGVGTLAAKGSDEWLLPCGLAPCVLDPHWWDEKEDGALTFELQADSMERGQGLHAAIGLWTPTALSAPDGPFTHGAEWGPGCVALFSDGTFGQWVPFPDLSLLAELGTTPFFPGCPDPLPPTCMLALACGAPIDVLDRPGHYSTVAWRPAVIRAVSLLPAGEPATWAPTTVLATVRVHFLGWGALWDETVEISAGSPWTRATLVRAGDAWVPLVDEYKRLAALGGTCPDVDEVGAPVLDDAPLQVTGVSSIHRVAPPRHHCVGVPGPPRGFMLRTPCGPTWDTGGRVRVWWRPCGDLAFAVDDGTPFLLPVRFRGLPVPVAATALSTTALRLLVSPSPASLPACMAPHEEHHAFAASLDACSTANSRRCTAATAEVTDMLDAMLPPGQSAQQAVRCVAPPRPKPCDCWRRHRAANDLADMCCPGISLSAALMTLRMCGDDQAAAADWLFSHGASSGPSGPLEILGPRADAILGLGTSSSLYPDSPLCCEGIPKACAGRSHLVLFEPVRYAESAYNSPDCGRSLLEHTPASFGAVPPPAPGLCLPFVEAEPADASAPLEGGPERYAGRWAVVRRGGCTFTSKARRIQAAGAAGCILISDDEGVAFVPDAGAEDANDVTIPYVLIGRIAGDHITRLARSSGSEEATLTLKVGLAEPVSSAGRETAPSFLSLSSLRAFDPSRAAALAVVPAATPPVVAGALLWRTAARNAVVEEGLEPLAQVTADPVALNFCHGSSAACEPGVEDGNDGLGARGLIRPADVARGVRPKAELALGTAAVQALTGHPARIGQLLRAAAAAGDALCDASGDSEATQARASGGAAPPPVMTAPMVRTEWSDEFGAVAQHSTAYQPPQASVSAQAASAGPLSQQRHVRARALSSGGSPALAALAPLSTGTPGSTAGSTDDAAAAAAAEESRWIASIELGLRLRHVAPAAIVSILELLRANDENSLAIARSMCDDVRLPIPQRPEPAREPPPLSLDGVPTASSPAIPATHAISPLGAHRQATAASHAFEALPASNDPDRPSCVCGVDSACPFAELAGPVVTPASVRVGLPVLLRYSLDEVHHWATRVTHLLRAGAGAEQALLRVGGQVLAQREDDDEWAAGCVTAIAAGEGPASVTDTITVMFDDWGDTEVLPAARVRPAQLSPSGGSVSHERFVSRVWRALPTASMLLIAAGGNVDAAMQSAEGVANAVVAAIMSTQPGRVVSCDPQVGSTVVAWRAATLSLPLSHLCRLQSVPSLGVGIAPVATARSCDLQLASRALNRASVCAGMLGIITADDARLAAAVAPLGVSLAAGLEWCDALLSFPAAATIVRAVVRGSGSVADALARLLGAPLHPATCLPDLLSVLDSAATGERADDARRAALHGLASGTLCVIQNAGDGAGRRSGQFDVNAVQGSRPLATLDLPVPLAVTASVEDSCGAVGVFVGLVASPEATLPVGTAVYIQCAPPIQEAHQPPGDARQPGSVPVGGAPPPFASLAPSATAHCYRGAGLHRDHSTTTDPNWPVVLIPSHPGARLWATFERAVGASAPPRGASALTHGGPCVAFMHVSAQWAAALAFAHGAIDAGAAGAVVRVALPFVANATTPYPFRLPWLRVCASALLALTAGSAPGVLASLQREISALAEELGRLHITDGSIVAGAGQSHMAAALVQLLAIARHMSPSTPLLSDASPFIAALDAAWAVHDLRVLHGRAWGGARGPGGATPTGISILQSLGPIRAARLVAFCSAAWLTESLGVHALEGAWKSCSVEHREAWAAASDGASEMTLQASMAVLQQSQWGAESEAELSVFIGALHAVLLSSGNAVDGLLSAEAGITLRVPTVEAVARELTAAAVHLGARRGSVSSPSVGLSSPTTLASYPALARCVMERGAPSLFLRYLLLRAVSRCLLPALGQLPVLDSNVRSCGACCSGSPVALISQLRLAVLPEVAEAWMRSVLKTSGVALRAQRQRFVLNRFLAAPPGTGAVVPWRSSLLGQIALALGRMPSVLLRQDGSAVPHLAFEVRLAGEKVIGESGPYREGFNALATEVMTDSRVLLPLPSNPSVRVPLPRLPARLQGSRVAPQPPLRAGAPTPSDTSPEAAAALLSSLGVLIGCALRTGTLLPLALPSFVWKAAVGDGHACQDACPSGSERGGMLNCWGTAHTLTPSLSRHAAGLSLGDLEALDSQLVRGTLLPLLHIQAEGDEKDVWEAAFGDGLTASTTTVLLPTPRGGEAWTHVVLEMGPGGAEVPLPLKDRAAYCAWAADAQLSLYEDSTAALVRGLWRVVPRAALTLMPWSALEAAVCGTPDVDVDMLARHTEYGAGSATLPVVSAFWALMRSADAAFRTRTVRFIFGMDRLPGTDAEWGRAGLRLLIKSSARPGVVLSRGGRIRAAGGGGFAPVATPPRPSYPGFLQEPAARGAPLPPAAGPPIRRHVDPAVPPASVSPGSAPPRREGSVVLAVTNAVSSLAGYAAAPAGLTQLQVDALLPTSDTCFGNLDLPAYSTFAVLEERLGLAITATELDADDV